MRTIELFCGTKSFSKVAAARGHDTFTVDLDAQFKPDLLKDVMALSPDELPGRPWIVWASPPCTCFSVMQIGNNWKYRMGVPQPQNDKTRHAVRVMEKTIALIKALNPVFYFIENPMGMMRTMPQMRFAPRRCTVTYCSYGDKRNKPTDIWTNCMTWRPKQFCDSPLCHHEKAPRGPANTGTQAMDSIEAGTIPAALIEEMIIACEQPKQLKQAKVIA